MALHHHHVQEGLGLIPVRMAFKYGFLHNHKHTT